MSAGCGLWSSSVFRSICPGTGWYSGIVLCIYLVQVWGGRTFFSLLREQPRSSPGPVWCRACRLKRCIQRVVAAINCGAIQHASYVSIFFLCWVYLRAGPKQYVYSRIGTFVQVSANVFRVSVLFGDQQTICFMFFCRLVEQIFRGFSPI